MTKVNSNNGNETKSDIFHGTYSNPLVAKYENISMAFLIGMFQFQFLKKARPKKQKNSLTLII